MTNEGARRNTKSSRKDDFNSQNIQIKPQKSHLLLLNIVLFFLIIAFFGESYGYISKKLCTFAVVFALKLHADAGEVWA